MARPEGAVGRDLNGDVRQRSQEVDAWLVPFRGFWTAHVDALERHLDRMDQLTPKKRKARRRR